MYRTILVSVDLGDTDGEALTIATAVAYAQAFDAQLQIMTVVPDYGLSIVGGFFPKGHEKEAIEHAQATLEQFTSQHVPETVRHHHIVGYGSIYRQILHHASVTQADLIILAAGRDDPDDYLIGPNAARVVRHAKASVLVVRRPQSRHVI